MCQVVSKMSLQGPQSIVVFMSHEVWSNSTIFFFSKDFGSFMVEQRVIINTKQANVYLNRTTLTQTPGRSDLAHWLELTDH